MNRRRVMVMVLCCVLSGAIHAEEPDWRPWAEVLASHVRPGERAGITVNLVEYAGLVDHAGFAAVVASVRSFDPGRLASAEEKLAFYINAYNILTIQLILDHWPVTGIREIGTIFRGPWSRVMLKNRDGKLTLDDIEHKIIRPLGEPRIHFAVNCASLSCPDLRMEPYTAARLDVQLDDQTRRFLQDPGKGVRSSGGKLYLSRLFDWYGDDFDGEGGVIPFLQTYGHGAGTEEVEGYLEYNWALNSAP